MRFMIKMEKNKGIAMVKIGLSVLEEFYKDLGKQQEQKEEIEYIEWLLEHKGKGYTREFYENNLQAKLDKLKQQIQEEKKQ